MKKEGRKTIVCSKKLKCGVMDRFTVVVAEKDTSDVMNKYKSIGYDVKEIG